jgi:hypothetical protein
VPRATSGGGGAGLRPAGAGAGPGPAVARDERLGEILVRADELEAVALEQHRIRAVGAEALSLEDEVGDPADQLLDGRRGVVTQAERVHAVSLYRRYQGLVKHWQEFFEVVTGSPRSAEA